ncbi:hypothetical protein VTO42DRAFT_5778 [Malbranchea cinnamomea]
MHNVKTLLQSRGESPPGRAERRRSALLTGEGSHFDKAHLRMNLRRDSGAYVEDRFVRTKPVRGELDMDEIEERAQQEAARMYRANGMPPSRYTTGQREMRYQGQPPSDTIRIPVQVAPAYHQEEQQQQQQMDYPREKQPTETTGGPGVSLESASARAPAQRQSMYIQEQQQPESMGGPGVSVKPAPDYQPQTRYAQQQPQVEPVSAPGVWARSATGQQPMTYVEHHPRQQPARAPHVSGQVPSGRYPTYVEIEIPAETAHVPIVNGRPATQVSTGQKGMGYDQERQQSETVRIPRARTTMKRDKTGSMRSQPARRKSAYEPSPTYESNFLYGPPPSLRTRRVGSLGVHDERDAAVAAAASAILGGPPRRVRQQVPRIAHEDYGVPRKDSTTLAREPRYAPEKIQYVEKPVPSQAIGKETGTMEGMVYADGPAQEASREFRFEGPAAAEPAAPPSRRIMVETIPQEERAKPVVVEGQTPMREFAPERVDLSEPGVKTDEREPKAPERVTVDESVTARETVQERIEVPQERVVVEEPTAMREPLHERVEATESHVKAEEREPEAPERVIVDEPVTAREPVQERIVLPEQEELKHEEPERLVVQEPVMVGEPIREPVHAPERGIEPSEVKREEPERLFERQRPTAPLPSVTEPVVTAPVVEQEIEVEEFQPAQEEFDIEEESSENEWDQEEVETEYVEETWEVRKREQAPTTAPAATAAAAALKEPEQFSQAAPAAPPETVTHPAVSTGRQMHEPKDFEQPVTTSAVVPSAATEPGEQPMTESTETTIPAMMESTEQLEVGRSSTEGRRVPITTEPAKPTVLGTRQPVSEECGQRAFATRESADAGALGRMSMSDSEEPRRERARDEELDNEMKTQAREARAEEQRKAGPEVLDEEELEMRARAAGREDAAPRMPGGQQPAEKGVSPTSETAAAQVPPATGPAGGTAAAAAPESAPTAAGTQPMNRAEKRRREKEEKMREKQRAKEEKQREKEAKALQERLAKERKTQEKEAKQRRKSEQKEAEQRRKSQQKEAEQRRKSQQKEAKEMQKARRRESARGEQPQAQQRSTSGASGENAGAGNGGGGLKGMFRRMSRPFSGEQSKHQGTTAADQPSFVQGGPQAQRAAQPVQ